MGLARHLPACVALLAAVTPASAAEEGRPSAAFTVIGLPEPGLPFTFDFPAMTAACFGTAWTGFTAAERTELIDLTSQLILKSFDRNAAKLQGLRVELAGDEKQPDGLILRRFLARSSDPKIDPIDFRMLFAVKDDKWAVEDLITEEVSLVKSYRGQFAKILKNEGYAVLIEKMRAKLKKDAAAEPK